VRILGGIFSAQRHQHRAERWIVNDVASVYIDGNEHGIKAHDSSYIQVGGSYTLVNKTSALFQLIEAQSGSHLGEDDIERLENLYGRC